MKVKRGLRLCLAGGGSGGHITPALALAEALEEAAPDSHVHLACSQRVIDAQVLEETSLPWTALPAEGLRRTPMGLLRFVKGMRAGRTRARALLQEEGIDAVALLGGFVAGSVLAAARQLGTPTILLNLDAIPGRANRWMARRVDATATAVPMVRPLGGSSDCPLLEGPLIRQAARPTPDLDRSGHRRLLGLDPDLPLLLVTGASQGASSLNDLMAHLCRAEADLLRGWQVLHLVGPGRCRALREVWAQVDIPAHVETFRHEMGPAWGAADLTVARAGASTVGEASFAGVPAIYLPYPHHRDQHQRHNAMPAQEASAARIVDDLVDPLKTWPAFRAALSAVIREGDLDPMTHAAAGRAGRHGGAHAAALLLELARANTNSAGASPLGG